MDDEEEVVVDVEREVVVWGKVREGGWGGMGGQWRGGEIVSKMKRGVVFERMAKAKSSGASK